MRHFLLALPLLLLTLLQPLPAAGQAPQFVPEVVKPAAPDKQAFTQPQLVKLSGMLGARIAANEAQRLLSVDETSLLEGFRNRPGKQAWIGEHVGKWLHASTLAWANTSDPKLREKLDRVVVELLKTQQPDGYLGTYAPGKHFVMEKDADWDVWVHKYNLLGLITYYQYTGNKEALAAARKIGDLLCATFGEGKKDIVKISTHMGMAASSVLEPMVLLYRHTGEKTYLEFAQYIVASWEQPHGPKIISSLTAGKGVNQTANGKAYEMMSCLVGVCELYRTTGDATLAPAVLNAWKDITQNRLYLTGGLSQGEHFKADHELPNVKANVSETCATVTWLQLNAQLLRITGDSRFADELERTVYNHLLAAQRPDGAQWCYFTELEGKKGYGPGTNCCVSSGPRGVALIPTFAYSTDDDGLVVNFYEPGKADLALTDGTKVGLEVTGSYPITGNFEITLHPAKPVNFTLRLRVPDWGKDDGMRNTSVKLNDEAIDGGGAEPGQYAPIARDWKDGDKLVIRAEFPPRPIRGEFTNQGKVAARQGPMVLALDGGLNPGLDFAALDFTGADTSAVQIGDEPFPATRKTFPGAGALLVRGIKFADGQSPTLRFVPFAEAGADGSNFLIWLKAGQ